MISMILGITGTRRGLTSAQNETLCRVVAALPDGAIHGGATGVDEQVDAFLVAAGMDPDDVLILPGHPDRERYWLSLGRKVHAARPPLKRNRTIVDDSDHLLAFPETSIEILRSGTWATIRYARSVGRGTTIVLPDGTVIEEKKEVSP